MKKWLVIGLATLAVFGLATVAIAAEVDIDGSIAGGWLFLNAKEYLNHSDPTSPLGAHHSFEAWGSFDCEVNFKTADSGTGGSGAGFANLDMNIPKAVSSSHAGFEAMWRQDFDTTDAWYGQAGVVGFFVEGDAGAELTIPRGNGPYHRNIQVAWSYGGHKEISADGGAAGNFKLDSWTESYTSYSDIGVNPPTDWSVLSVVGTGGKADLQLGYAVSTGAGSTGTASHSSGCGGTQLNVTGGTGIYTRSLGGDTFLDSEIYTALLGGSFFGSGGFVGGMSASPWTDAK